MLAVNFFCNQLRVSLWYLTPSPSPLHTPPHSQCYRYYDEVMMRYEFDVLKAKHAA